MLNIKKLNKAIQYVKNKDFDSAEKIYSELLREYPNDDTVLSFWGLFNIKKGLFKKAEKILEKSYSLKKAPSTIAALILTKYQLKKYDDTIILCEEMFKYDKDSEHLYQKIIECFRFLNMYNFAGAYCQKYITAHPESPTAKVRLCQNYMDIRDYKKAEKLCAEIMKSYPQNPLNWINAGLLQELIYNNEEYAQECYKQAIELNFPIGYYHLAVSLQKVGKFEEAEENYKKAYEYFPTDNDIKASIGCFYLQQRNFEQGFDWFNQREKSKTVETLKNFYSECNKDSTVLVYSDMGLGDGLQFSRYLPYLKEKCKNVIAYVRKPLTKILQRSFPDIKFYDSGLADLEYDTSLLMVGLPYYLNMLYSDIPMSDGYLNADEEKVQYFKDKYFKTDKLKVGLCWRAGDLSIRTAINRTINIDYFKSLLELENVEFYSFQKDDIFDACKKYPQIIDLSKEFDSFDDTASAMKNLDLMISVDSACIHLAGALGVKSLLLLPYCTDWRWFDNTQTTEWYSSVQIIKQVERQDWFKEIDKCKQFVIDMIK